MTERNGFAGYPVVTKDNELVGTITGRDVRFVTDLDQPVTAAVNDAKRAFSYR